MGKVIKKMPHAAKGIAFGDVSNSAVRNILSEVSKKLYGNVTINALEETEEYFGWCCPYTGRYLKDDIVNGTNNVQCDHIISQNQDHAGLNIIGNLVYVDKKANKDKGDMDFEDFINSDAVDGTPDEKAKRIKKIRDWQAGFKYDGSEFENALSVRLQEIYIEVRETQERYISEMLGIIGSTMGLKPMTSATISKTETTKSVYVKSGPGVGQYIKGEITRLLESGMLTSDMIENLKDKSYCSKNLGISFVVIVETTDIFESKRYYKDIVCTKYRICSQWTAKHRAKFDKWLTEIES